MNPIYTKEIGEDLSRMGLDPEILSIEESFQKSEGK